MKHLDNKLETVIRMFGLMSIVIMLSLIASGCAYNRAEIQSMWRAVATEYPGCREMPKIVMLDDGTVGGFYIVNEHTVVIDKYASDEVWEHEFRHSCGDRLGEVDVAFEGGSIYSLADSYRRYTGQE